MESSGASHLWASGAAYDPSVGQWSRVIAHQFVPSLVIEAERHWLDVGCGTGVLTRAILGSRLRVRSSGLIHQTGSWPMLAPKRLTLGPVRDSNRGCFAF